MSDKFGSIYTEVQEAVTKEYSEQEDVLQGVEDHITRLQMALMAEQHRRVVQLKTVESNLATLYKSIQVQCHAQLEALRPDVSTRVAAWHERLDDAFRMLDEEKAARKVVINRERLKLLKTVDDFEKQVPLVTSSTSDLVSKSPTASAACLRRSTQAILLPIALKRRSPPSNRTLPALCTAPATRLSW